MTSRYSTGASRGQRFRWEKSQAYLAHSASQK